MIRCQSKYFADFLAIHLYWIEIRLFCFHWIHIHDEWIYVNICLQPNTPSHALHRPRDVIHGRKCHYAHVNVSWWLIHRTHEDRTERLLEIISEARQIFSISSQSSQSGFFIMCEKYFYRIFGDIENVSLEIWPNETKSTSKFRCNFGIFCWTLRISW